MELKTCRMSASSSIISTSAGVILVTPVSGTPFWGEDCECRPGTLLARQGQVNVAQVGYRSYDGEAKAGARYRSCAGVARSMESLIEP